MYDFCLKISLIRIIITCCCFKTNPDNNILDNSGFDMIKNLLVL